MIKELLILVRSWSKPLCIVPTKPFPAICTDATWGSVQIHDGIPPATVLERCESANHILRAEQKRTLLFKPSIESVCSVVELHIESGIPPDIQFSLAANTWRDEIINISDGMLLVNPLSLMSIIEIDPWLEENIPSRGPLALLEPTENVCSWVRLLRLGSVLVNSLLFNNIEVRLDSRLMEVGRAPLMEL